MEQVAKAVDKTGLRGVLAQAVFDEMGPENIDTSLEESLKFARRFNDYANGRVTSMLGFHCTFTCSTRTLRQVREIADEEGFRIHIHLAEGEEEVEIIKERYSKTPVRFLNDVRLWGPDLLGAHVIYVDREEISILSQANAKVNHNPTANTKGASGTSPVPEMLDRGGECVSGD